nr:MAG TPA: Protein of unknown function (DUF3262) [Caudoviricetes sp.]
MVYSQYKGGSNPSRRTIRQKDPQPLWLRVFLVLTMVCWFFTSEIYEPF